MFSELTLARALLYNQRMKSLILLLAFIALPALSSVKGGDICARIFAESVVPRILKFEDPMYVSFLDGSLYAQLSSTKSFLYGQGNFAEVHLVQDVATKTVLVEKRYENNYWGLDQAKEDQALLQQFRATTEGKPVAFYFSSLEGSGHILSARFVPGKTVHDLLVRSELSENERMALRKIYNDKLVILYKQLRKDPRFTDLDLEPVSAKFAFRDEKPDGAYMIKGTARIQGKSMIFLIKSDNVIVHPEDLNHMTVIDPI